MEEAEFENIEYDADEALIDITAIMEWQYFDFMMNNDSVTAKDFKRYMVGFTKLLCEKIHDRYCDHVESIRKEKRARVGLRTEL